MMNIIIALLICLTVPVFAVDYYLPNSVGNSAENISLGVEGFGVGAQSVFENPASLRNAQSFSVAGFNTKLMNNFNYSNVAISKSIGNSRFALGVYELKVPDIAKTDDILNPEFGENEITQIGSFRYRNLMAKVAYQRHLSDVLSMGFSGTYFETSMDSIKGTGYNLDLGLFFAFNSLDISIVGRNLVPISDVTYNDASSSTESLPIQGLFGVRKRFSQIHLMGQIKMPSIGNENQNRQLLSGGIQYVPSLIKNWIYVAGSYKQFYVLDQIKGRFAVGIGLTLPIINVNYAYEKSDYILTDGHHYVSMAVVF